MESARTHYYDLLHYTSYTSYFTVLMLIIIVRN